jgi:Fe-S cluster assembly protein SufD
LFLFFSDTQTSNSFSQPRNLIIAEENSQVSVIENFVTLGEQESLINIVTEIVVEKRAIVNHYKIQGETTSNFHVGTTQVLQKENSNFANTTITMGGGIIRNNLNIEMDGEHIESYMNGLFMLNGKSHVDNHTVVDHQKPNGYSNELYKGILDDNSTGVFNGKIYVREDAQKTNAFQTNNNIILSDKATVDTKPQLEIWADDVKCSHGATVGALDEEPLFYLRSRGIPKDKARGLLMFAFATDLLDRIKIEPLRKHVEELIAERLGYEQ